MNLFLMELNKLLHEREYNPALNQTASYYRGVANVIAFNNFSFFGSEELDLIGYYVFSTMTKVQARHAGARMFAPRFGIPEEPATGMAAGPLACFLHDHLGVEDRELLIEQGRLMQPPSPSVIRVILDVVEGKISRLMAGGTARAVSSLQVEV